MPNQRLKEDCHPYVTLVENGLEQLLDAPTAGVKMVPIMPQVVAPLRQGLSNKQTVRSILNQAMFLVALNVFKKIAVLIKGEMVRYLNMLLPPIASQIMHKEHRVRDAIHETLMELQLHCGPDALKIIKKKGKP
jgi:Parkin co-regulated protein